MQRQDVTSSSVLSVGYDEDTHTLEVEFRGNRVYQYFNVPSGVFNELMSAESHGKYLDQFVKKAGYEYRELK